MPPGFFSVPNVPYLIASFFHAAGLAVWLGGIVVLGAVVAPALFRRLPRAEAGALFGPMLAVFEKISLGAAAAAVGGEIAKAVIGGQNANAWIFARDTSLAVMVLLLLIANFRIHPAIRAIQGDGALPDDDPRRVRFQKLHRVSERLMSAQLFLGIVVLLFA